MRMETLSSLCAILLSGCLSINLPTPSPLLKSVSLNTQSASTNIHPRAVMVGALDSFAPVFALQFSDTDRRPVAVLELNADDALNTYSVVGTITYTNLPPAPK